MNPLKIDWQQFIRNGYDRVSEVLSAQKDLTKNIEYAPKDGNLFVTARIIGGIRHYVVVCRCGNSRMLVHENGIRCHVCGRFHTHTEYQKQKIEARKQAQTTDSKILTNPQPFQVQEEIRKHYVRINQRAKRGFTGTGARKRT